MKNITKELRDAYERDLNSFPSDIEFERTEIDYQDVLKSHYLVADYFLKSGEQGILCGVKNPTLLGSAIGRQHVEWAGQRKWTEQIDLCSTLFFGLVKNHAFHDGNKRTALLTLLHHLYKINRVPISKQSDFEAVTVMVAKGDYSSLVYSERELEDDEKILAISKFLRKSTRKSDKNFYALTYKELDEKLKNYGFYLGNEDRGYIDVLQNSAPSLFQKAFGIKGKTRKVVQIGFFGWHRQVTIKAVKSILRETGLTAENGIDSNVFYKDGDPLFKLIDDFHGPLLRLKDK